jgi:hypothetical protein
VADHGERSAFSPGAAVGGAPRWGLGVLVALVLLAQLRFVLLDPRVPWDPNLCYQRLPELLAALRRPGPGWAEALGLALTETTAAYDLVLALPMALGLPRIPVLEGFGLLWVAAVLLGTAGIAQRLFGARAALLAVALLASGWSVVVLGRSGWIHVPELALVLLALWALLRDPGLERWGSALLLGLAGAGAMSLRPSGVVWVASLLPLLLLGSRRHLRASSGRLVLVAGLWALGATPAAVELLPYLQGKLERREGYEHVVAPAVLLRQLALHAGLVPTALGLLGLGVLLRSRGSLPAPRGPLLLLGAWLAAGPLLVLGFRAGLDNFPAVIVAMAVLGAGGLVRLPRPFMVLPLLVFALRWLPQWLPEHPAPPRLPAARELLQDHPGLSYRVDARLDPAVVLALLDASCPFAGTCRVLVDHGLFAPGPEEPGRHELFLLGRERVEPLPVWMPDSQQQPLPVSALASYGCESLDPLWDKRRPSWRQDAAGLRRKLRLELVWEADLGNGCRYRWFTPRGQVHHPERMP